MMPISILAAFPYASSSSHLLKSRNSPLLFVARPARTSEAERGPSCQAASVGLSGDPAEFGNQGKCLVILPSIRVMTPNMLAVAGRPWREAVSREVEHVSTRVICLWSFVRDDAWEGSVCCVPSWRWTLTNIMGFREIYGQYFCAILICVVSDVFITRGLNESFVNLCDQREGCRAVYHSR